jgi:hypothetical protein
MVECVEFRVQKFQGLGYRVKSLGIRVYNLELGVEDQGFRV